MASLICPRGYVQTKNGCCEGCAPQTFTDYGYRAIEDVRPGDYLRAPDLGGGAAAHQDVFVKVLETAPANVGTRSEGITLLLEQPSGRTWTVTLDSYRHVTTYYRNRVKV